jgi:hypothetical protein
VRGVLLKLFDDHVVDEVRSIYKAVNALLVKNSILPKIRYGVSKKAEGKSASKGARDDEDEEKEGALPACAQGAERRESFSRCCRTSVANGVGVAEAGSAASRCRRAPVILQGPELLGSLTRIQQGARARCRKESSEAAASGRPNVLRELKTSTLRRGSAADGRNRRWTSCRMLFDQLFDDPQIPAAPEGPDRPAADSDAEGGDRRQSRSSPRRRSPARRLLDTFGEVARAPAADFSADSTTFVHLEAIVQHLVNTFEDDVSVFERASEQVTRSSPSTTSRSRPTHAERRSESSRPRTCPLRRPRPRTR